ncbi:Ig-like domain-containing protein [Dyadobacter sp. CY345]|uniref:Ig-like domain-containing protein n=1 Tax=Dyadobacter sp. CY345 TaxID=2909335 RepID=UPI001F38FB6A|nr:Ig-like domain-containing protein [Dyadobacter sp. CY345]MCF2443733.1 Ig-like domain-containing protein [Dyadobacter sp. CY345]
MKHFLFVIFGLLLLNSCKKEIDPQPVLDKNRIELKYDHDYQLVISKGENLVQASSYQWTSSDANVASVSANGKISARKVGKTTITAIADGQELVAEITVTPYVSFFQEPQLEFTSDKATIMSSALGNLVYNQNNIYVYSGISDKISRIMYIFDDNNMILSMAIDFVDDEQTRKDVTTFYAERYPITTLTDKNETIYINDEKNKAVWLTANESLGFYVSYGKVTIVNGRMSAVPNYFDQKM